MTNEAAMTEEAAISDVASRAAQIRVQRSGAVLVVYLDNPGRRNAWTQAMRAEIRRHLIAAAKDGSVTGVVISGGSPDAFCAGQDLDEATTRLVDDADNWISELKATLDAPRLCPKPVVAAVCGVAAGSGLQFALACDAIVTHPEARLGQPEVKSGMASVTGSWMLQRSIGTIRMRDMVLSARLLSGTKAHEWGLVNCLVASDEVLDRAVRMVRERGDLPPDAYGLTKQALTRLEEQEYEAAFALSARYQRESFDAGTPQAVRAARRSRGTVR